MMVRAQTAREPSVNAPLEGRATVWLLEDSRLEAELATRVLAERYTVEVFTDGSSLLERLAGSREPEVLILDWNLPGMSGLEVCQFVRSAYDKLSLPILMLTVYGHKPDLVAGLAAGANDYVTKPYDPAELMARVEGLVQVRRLHRQVRDVWQVRAEREAAEQALATQSLLTRTITDNANAALLLMDDRQRCTFMNPAAEAMTGYTFEEIRAQDRPVHEIIHHSHPDGRPYPIGECPIDRALPERNRMQGEDVFVHKDGHFYPVAFTASPIIKDGKPLGTVIEVRDTTAEKAAEHERRRAQQGLAFLAEASSLLASTLDLESSLAAVAKLTVPSFADVCAIDLVQEEGAIRRSVLVHRDPERAMMLDELRRRYPPDPARHPVFSVVRSGQSLWIPHVLPDMLDKIAQDAEHRRIMQEIMVTSQVVVPLVARGRVLGTLGLGRQHGPAFDASDLALAEDLGRRAGVAIDNAQLFELTQQESRRAEEANRAKDLFLSTLSHELRTPLNAILGWTRMLRAGTLPEAKRERALDTIDRNTRAQVALIEDILDLSRIASGKLRLNVAPVEVYQIVEAALDTVRPAADARGVRLQPVLDPDAGSLHGDATRLQQIVWNLLSNAVKFTPKGGRVYVRLERQDSHVQIVVADTGQGIESAFLPHVFEAFRQQDSTTTRLQGGLGLGLAIVKHLVELHGGTIQAESEGKGRGATFTVRLPIAPIRMPPSPEGGKAVVMRAGMELECPNELEGLRILACDDEEDARELLQTVLEHCKATVTTVGSAAAALLALREGSFDVLVSDVGMPDEDGYSLIRKVRALPASQGGRVPAVALTAYASVTDRTRALMAGFHAHAVKPIEPQELIVVIANLVGRFSNR